MAANAVGNSDDEPKSSINTRIEPRVGFHFASVSHLQLNHPRRCAAVQIHYTLPPDIIVDPYELDLHHEAFSYELNHQPDLERPVFAAATIPAVLKVVVSPSLLQEGRRTLDMTIPLHARYGSSSHHVSADEAYEILRFPQPHANWRCMASDGTLYHEAFVLNATVPEITVLLPLGRSQDAEVVEIGTMGVVLCMFLYLLSTFTATARRLTRREKEIKENKS